VVELLTQNSEKNLHFEDRILSSFLSLEKRIWGEIDVDSARAYKDQQMGEIEKMR
jgi:hypothetical protein